MNWVFMFMAVGLTTVIGASAPLLFGHEFLGAWSTISGIIGAFTGVAIHLVIRKTGYIE